MKNNNTTRRAILAGAAALPVLAVPAAALSNNGNSGIDPIFAAIEKHKETYLKWATCGLRESRMSFEDPAYAEVQAASGETLGAAMDAGQDLVEIQPTTITGLVALLEHIGHFNAGGVKREGVPKEDDWASSPHQWPAIEDDEGDLAGLDMFAFEMLANVRASLKALAVQP